MAVVCGPCCTATRPDPSPKKSNPHKEKRFQKTCPGGVHWSGLFRRRPSPDSKEVGSENEKPAGQKLNTIGRAERPNRSLLCRIGLVLTSPG